MDFLGLTDVDVWLVRIFVSLCVPIVTQEKSKTFVTATPEPTIGLSTVTPR